MRNKFPELIVRLIIKRGGSILLCKNKSLGHYYLPGGHVEYGDSLEKTIYKEMNEELGLSVENIKNVSYVNYFEHMYHRNGEEYHELNMIFNVRVSEDIDFISQEDDIGFDLIDLKDIKNVNLLPKNII